MRAIILAAGLGLRLQQPPEAQFPKCLLRFDDVSLLERHLRVLDAAGVDEIVLGLGFQAEKVEQELKRLGRQAEIVVNERYDLGSVLTVHTVADAMTRGGDVLLMDADVLYDENILHALVADADKAVDRLLIDRDFEAGDEPVKLCLKNGVPVELRKQLAVDLEYDTIGESVASSASPKAPHAASRRSSRATSTAAARTCRTKKPCATCCSKAVTRSTSPTSPARRGSRSTSRTTSPAPPKKSSP
ncbi:Bifunctional protein GlmU [Burkholderia cepacia]|nr:Bifunctional protein GlmU [Burkholderia cepacia]